MAQKKQQIQITEAFIYFNTPITMPLQESILEKHMNIISRQLLNKKLIIKIIPLLVQRYYEIVNSRIKIEQFLFIKLIKIINSYFLKLQNTQKQIEQQMFIVFIWASINNLKSIQASKSNRQIILTTIICLKDSISSLKKYQNFNLALIYPQISSILLNYMTQAFDFIVFRESCSFFSSLFTGCMSKVSQQSQIITLKQNQKNLQLNIENLRPNQRFIYQCTRRLQSHFQVMSLNFGTKSHNFKQILRQNLLCIKPICVKFSRLVTPFYKLLLLCGGCLQDDSISPIQMQSIKLSITLQFASLLSKIQLNTSKKDHLHQILSICPYIELHHEELQDKIMKIILNKLYLIQNSNQLVIPHHSIVDSINLEQLVGKHSFSTYNMPLSSILNSLDFEINRFLVIKLPYAQISLQNVQILKQIIQNISSAQLNIILANLTTKLQNYENQYQINMSLTKFSQFMTKIVVIYWIFSKNSFEPSQNISQSLFSNIISSQSLRILTPSFKQQQILMSLLLQLCYLCYSKTFSKYSPLKKLQKKICLLEIIINNIYQESFVVKLSCYHILLSLAAPDSIDKMMENLQSTLINRNIHNLKFLISLVKLSNISQNQCQDLAQKVIQSQVVGVQQLLNIIFTRLSISMMRKCILAASSANGRWVYILLNNTKYLYNIQIKQGEIKDKQDNFHMNDGQNVIVSNALGVIILELGQKWQYSLLAECPAKQAVIDVLVELLEVDIKLVFFKARFTTIFVQLIILLQYYQNQNQQSIRIRSKIYKIIDLIPQQQIILYINDPKPINSENTGSSFPKTNIKYLESLIKIIQSCHKKYQLKYLSQFNKQNQLKYDLSDRLLSKLYQIKSAIE